MSFDKSSKKRAAKSHKADGTPKKRWSAAERAEKGHGPRTRGGRRDNDFAPRWGSQDRTERRDGDRSRDGDRNRAWGDRPQRSDRFPRDDRRDDRRPNRDDRPRFERNDRFNDRDDRRSRPARDGHWGGDVRAREDRGGRVWTGERDDRPRRNDRFERRDRFDRDDRPRRFDRDDRPGDRFDRDDRPRRFDRDDRPQRNDRFERDDRPRRNDRFDRPERGDRFDRGDRRDRPYNENHGPRTPRHDAHGAWGRPAEDEASQDVMAWEQEEIQDLDISGVDHEGGFSALGLPDEIVAILTQRGITEPFPIQVATIPDAIAGRDVLGRARTGSGKTLAFSLPVVTRLSQDPDAPQFKSGRVRTPRAMVLVPTRELALQVADVLSPLAASLNLKLVLVAGGMSYGPQLKAFDKGVDIVVATPGRLIDLLEQGAADLSNVQITVLDEADHMADLGFMPAVTTLLDAVAEGGQKLLFSATLDGAVDRLVRRYMNDPALHEVDPGKGGVTTMRHEVLLVRPHDKNEVTARIANREGRTVIFARTQLGTDRVAGQLRDAGVMAGALHGGLTQGARARILAAFKEGTLPVLVATDVAARGIHVDEVSLVLQLDPPMNAKDYTHRAGRTARAGEEGAVVSIVLPHQRRQTLRMIGSAGVKVDPIEVRPEDETLAELTGAVEPSGEAITEDQFKALVAPRQTARRPRPEGGRGGWNRDKRGGFNRDKRGGGFQRGNKGGHGRPRIAEAGGWNRES